MLALLSKLLFDAIDYQLVLCNRGHFACRYAADLVPESAAVGLHHELESVVAQGKGIAIVPLITDGKCSILHSHDLALPDEAQI